MARSAPIDKAHAAETAAWAAASAVRNPDEISAADAVALYQVMERVARAAGAAKLLLAKRVEASGEAQRRGYRTTAELLAKLSGSSLGAAKGDLETSEALDDLPETKDALLGGDVSPEQGKIVAGAAKTNPQAERRLLERAKTANNRELQEEAQKARAEADPDPEATHRRIHQDRRLSQFTDAEGAWNIRGRGTVEDGAIVQTELDRLRDEIFRERGKSGTTECSEAYVFDAMRRMAERSRELHLGGPADAGPRRQPAPQHLALLRLDITALWRGYVRGDELCEITGLGPIPVATAKRLLGDAVLKLLITNGVDVAHVTSLTRGPTQAMHYASLWTSPTCVVEGCTRTIVEYDHRTGAEYKDTKHTRLDEIDRVCCGHHDLHSHKGWALVVGKGKRPMVPPEDPRHPNNWGATSGDPPPEERVEMVSALADAAHAAVTARRRTTEPSLFAG
jgi:hypothetical protein